MTALLLVAVCLTLTAALTPAARRRLTTDHHTAGFTTGWVTGWVRLDTTQFGVKLVDVLAELHRVNIAMRAASVSARTLRLALDYQAGSSLDVRLAVLAARRDLRVGLAADVARVEARWFGGAA